MSANQPRFQQRHWDYVMGGPLLQSTQFKVLASVAANQLIEKLPLVTDQDAPFLLRSIAARVQYDTSVTSHRQTGLEQLQIRFTGPTENYLQQALTPLNVMTPYAGQLGNPLPLHRQVVFPPRSALFVDLLNNGSTALTNLTLYFRGVKLFPWGVHPAPQYPPRVSTLGYTYLVGQSPSTNTSLLNIPVTTGSAGQRFQFQATSDGDFVLRSIQAGPTVSNTSWEVFLRLRDSDEYPYSNDFVHFDVLAGNSTGPATFSTGTSFQAAVGTGPSVPGVFFPEIYIPNQRFLIYEVYRADSGFGTAIAQDFPMTFMGAKVFQR